MCDNVNLSYLSIPLLLCIQADDYQSSQNPDLAGPVVDIMGSEEEDTPSTPSSSSSAGTSSSSSTGPTPNVSEQPRESDRPRGPVRSSSSRGRSALRKYIEGFDQAAMIETARVVSAEGAALVERQTTGLFGDIKALTIQMQV